MAADDPEKYEAPTITNDRGIRPYDVVATDPTGHGAKAGKRWRKSMTDSNRAGGLHTAESVTEGHPDKVADQISDAILDACLAQDPDARVACETLVTAGQVILAGEITTSAQVDREAIARQVIAEVGYTDPALGFAAETVRVTDLIGGQSPEIAAGVDRSLEARAGADVDDLSGEGAGDQGIMIGYATDETRELIPFPLSAAHRLARRLAEVRRDGTLPWLRPDGKTPGDRRLRRARAPGPDRTSRPDRPARPVRRSRRDPSGTARACDRRRRAAARAASTIGSRSIPSWCRSTRPGRSRSAVPRQTPG